VAWGILSSTKIPGAADDRIITIYGSTLGLSEDQGANWHFVDVNSGTIPLVVEYDSVLVQKIKIPFPGMKVIKRNESPQFMIDRNGSWAQVSETEFHKEIPDPDSISIWAKIKYKIYSILE